MQATGWLGTMLYLGAHLYLSGGGRAKWTVYYTVNFIAAFCISITSAVLHSWQAVIINVCWGLISAAGMGRLSLKFLRFNPVFLEVALGLCFVVSMGSLPFAARFSIALLAWSATLAFSFGYLLCASERITKRCFFLYNAYAALVILPQLWIDTNYPTLALEVLWFGISLFGWGNSRKAEVGKVPQKHVSD